MNTSSHIPLDLALQQAVAVRIVPHAIGLYAGVMLAVRHYLAAELARPAIAKRWPLAESGLEFHCHRIVQ